MNHFELITKQPGRDWIKKTTCRIRVRHFGNPVGGYYLHSLSGNCFMLKDFLNLLRDRWYVTQQDQSSSHSLLCQKISCGCPFFSEILM
jgi:hypothetical protein